jgi:hypothetical protein
MILEVVWRFGNRLATPNSTLDSGGRHYGIRMAGIEKMKTILPLIIVVSNVSILLLKYMYIHSLAKASPAIRDAVFKVINLINNLQSYLMKVSAWRQLYKMEI